MGEYADEEFATGLDRPSDLRPDRVLRKGQHEIMGSLTRPTKGAKMTEEIDTNEFVESLDAEIVEPKSLVTRQPPGLVQYERPLSMEEAVKAAEGRVMLVKKIISTIMEDGKHYGTIPGAGKKACLFKAGAEVLALGFQSTMEVLQVEDLGVAGEEVRYRITIGVRSRVTGAILGHGVGECSSDESKYRWRAAVCEEEWNETKPELRRKHWKKGYGNNPPTSVLQVRVDVADVANTILKMAAKRARADAALTAFAASEFFTQDVEDMPRELLGDDPVPQPPKKPAPAPRPAPRPAQNPVPSAQEPRPAPNSGPRTVGEALQDQIPVQAPASDASEPLWDGPEEDYNREPGDDDADDVREMEFDQSVVYLASTVPFDYPKITDKQLNRLFAKGHTANLPPSRLKKWVEEQIGFADVKLIPAYATYDRLCNHLDEMAKGR